MIEGQGQGAKQLSSRAQKSTIDAGYRGPGVIGGINIRLVVKVGIACATRGRKADTVILVDSWWKGRRSARGHLHHYHIQTFYLCCREQTRLLSSDFTYLGFSSRACRSILLSSRPPTHLSLLVFLREAPSTKWRFRVPLPKVRPAHHIKTSRIVLTSGGGRES